MIRSGCCARDPFGILEVGKASEIAVFEATEDVELHSYLKRNQLPFVDWTIQENLLPLLPELHENFNPQDYPVSDPSGKKIKADPPFLIRLYPNRFTQFSSVFSAIRKTLVEQPELKDKLTLFVNSDQDYDLSLYSDLFEIPCFTSKDTPLVTIPEVKERLKQIYEAKSFHVASTSDNPYLKMIDDIIADMELDKLDFDFAYANLLVILTEKKRKVQLSDRGIRTTSSIEIDPDREYFILDFQKDVFYKYADDNNVLSDDQLVSIDANPSYTLTLLEKRIKLNFIRYNKIRSASRVKLHLTDALYDSQFVDEFNWKVTNATFDQEGFYTEKIQKLLLSYYKDALLDYHREPEDIYRSYDSSFEKLNLPQVHPDKFSVTGIEKYCQCPYQYYLDRVLKLSKCIESDSYNMWIGELCHYVMRFIFDDDFNFERCFEEGKRDYIKNVQEANKEYTAYDDMLLYVLKYWFGKSVFLLRKQCDPAIMTQIQNLRVHETYEREISYSIPFEGENYDFTGRIDKIVYTADPDSSKYRYYTIIDYKTGAESLNVKECFLGKAIQLPLYYYALENDERNENLRADMTVGSIGIQHILLGKAAAYFVDESHTKLVRTFYKKTALQGLGIDDPTYAKSFDRSDTKSKNPISSIGPFIVISNHFSKGEIELSKKEKYSLEKFYKDIFDLIGQSIKKIKENDFPIQFLTTDKDRKKSLCKFCPYGNLCYKKGSDFKDGFKLMKDKFTKKEAKDETE